MRARGNSKGVLFLVCLDSVFALLLLAFECRFASMEPTIRQYFGFLFTYRGRTTFLFLYVLAPCLCFLVVQWW